MKKEILKFNQLLLRTDYSLKDVCFHSLYLYHRNRTQLEDMLIEDIEMYRSKEELFLDEYDSYDLNGGFTPETDVERMIKIFQYDLVFKSRVIEQYEMCA